MRKLSNLFIIFLALFFPISSTASTHRTAPLCQLLLEMTRGKAIETSETSPSWEEASTLIQRFFDQQISEGSEALDSSDPPLIFSNTQDSQSDKISASIKHLSDALKSLKDRQRPKEEQDPTSLFTRTNVIEKSDQILHFLNRIESVQEILEKPAKKREKLLRPIAEAHEILQKLGVCNFMVAAIGLVYECFTLSKYPFPQNDVPPDTMVVFGALPMGGFFVLFPGFFSPRSLLKKEDLEVDYYINRFKEPLDDLKTSLRAKDPEVWTHLHLDRSGMKFEILSFWDQTDQKRKVVLVMHGTPHKNPDLDWL